MSSDFKNKYGTTNQAITITLNSLASSTTAGRQSTVIDNRTNLFMDALVAMLLTIPTGGTVGNDKCIYVKVFGTADDTNFRRRARRGRHVRRRLGQAMRPTAKPIRRSEPAL